MKSKKVIFILILVIATLILWRYGFFSRYNYLTAKSDIANKNIQIIYTGESVLTTMQLNSIGKKYGFKVKDFESIISSAQENGIKIYNSQMDDYLDEINEKGWKSKYKVEIDALIKLNNIPDSSFWVENNNKGYWYYLESLHSHRNRAKISIYDKLGNLIANESYFLVCRTDEIEFIEDLEKQIDFFDGENIQFKSDCFLMLEK